MAFLALFEDQKVEARKAAASDLKYLLEESEMTEEVRDWLYFQGVTTVRRLAGLEDTRARVREVLRDEMGFKAEESPMKVINAISDVLSAWEDAKAQATRAAT